jgi:DNA invertase Pin-like site-specific DNA recombinase
MRAALYIRVSTQHKGQEQPISSYSSENAAAPGICRSFENTKTTSPVRNPSALDLRKCCAAARRFDLLFFWSLDRLTREGTLATLKYLELLETYGVGWRSLTEPWIDSAGPFRDVIISLLASLARQERVRISERVRAGLSRAKQYGTRSGRSIGRPRAVFQRDRALELRREGLSWRKIAKTIGVSPSNFRRACHSPTEGRQP